MKQTLFIIGLYLGSMFSPSSFAAQDNLNPEYSFETIVYEESRQVDLGPIDPRWIVTIASLETNHGRGKIYKNSNNLFSIKADCKFDGCAIASYMGYRIYKSRVLSIKDFVRLISTRTRYINVYHAAQAHDRDGFFWQLQNCGFAEDPHYFEKLKRVYNEIFEDKPLCKTN